MALKQLNKLSVEDMAKTNLVKIRTLLSPDRLMIYKNEEANYLIRKGKDKFVICLEYSL